MRVVGVALIVGLLGFVSYQLANRDEPSEKSGADERASTEKRVVTEHAEGRRKKKRRRSNLAKADEAPPLENPGAKAIREALDTPIQNFFASVSPIWVQIRRVLNAHGDEEWVSEVNEMISSIRDARRTIGFEGEYLLGRQNTLMESLWSAEFLPALKQDLATPLRVLGERTEAFSSQ